MKRAVGCPDDNLALKGSNPGMALRGMGTTLNAAGIVSKVLGIRGVGIPQHFAG
jgi:hypothetical protein